MSPYQGTALCSQVHLQRGSLVHMQRGSRCHRSGCRCCTQGSPDWPCWTHTGLHCGGSDMVADACGADECRAGALSRLQPAGSSCIGWCIGIRAVWTGRSWNLC